MVDLEEWRKWMTRKLRPPKAHVAKTSDTDPRYTNTGTERGGSDE